MDKAKLATDAEALSAFNRGIVEEFRANEGTVGSMPGGAVLLLHTTGARSGEPRLSPLAYMSVDGRMLIVGSYLGSAKDPAWVHNLRARPRALVEVGSESYEVVTRELPREERDALFPHVAALVPVLADYQASTDRVIPLFELARI